MRWTQFTFLNPPGCTARWVSRGRDLRSRTARRRVPSAALRLRPSHIGGTLVTAHISPSWLARCLTQLRRSPWGLRRRASLALSPGLRRIFERPKTNLNHDGTQSLLRRHY